MEQFGLENIRNVVLLSHAGAGKTSTSEAILFTAGAIKRLGKVDDGSSTSDYDPDEIKRKISINLTLLPCQWRDIKINLLDTPGYPDFVAEVRAAMRVSEGAIIVVCAASGVEVGTEQVWEYCQEAKLPRLIFVNKMDRENADFFRTVAAIQAKFGPRCLPTQLPIGAQNNFQGVVDLLTLKSYTGSPPQEGEAPSSLEAQINSFREKLVEAVAETDDALIEKYLGGEELSLEELKTGLRQATLSGRVVPILTGSALQNTGVNWLLDAVYQYLPSPKEQPVTVITDSAEEQIEPTEDAPLAALVFKTTADPYVGKLTYFRVYTGAIESNSQVWNTTRGSAERIGQLFMPRGKNQEPVAKVSAGDIGAVAKLSVTVTGDTLSSQNKPVKLAPITFPEPAFEEAVYPKTKADLDKLGSALSRITEEDPTLRVRREPDTGETILAGIGETQLEVAAEKMQRKFGVSVNLETPKVPYKETITIPVPHAEYKHKKQTGGHGQYGHVIMELEPLPRGSGNQFAERIVGGTVPKNYIPAVEKGFQEAVQDGVLAHYPVVDVKATLYDGSFHPVDSSEICFKIAGAQAMKKGLAQGQPILLEPIMNIRITVPNELTGDIIGDLNTKRARVQGMNPEGDLNVIEAQVPLAEVLRYATDLKSMTQGRGSFKMEFSHYEEVPPQISQKIIAQRQAEKAAEKT
ncbi:MAG TPA: elongation factor G [Dehalococcoidia bacterium]|nr:elongation factor G [Dehalococcoidia bacterium]